MHLGSDIRGRNLADVMNLRFCQSKTVCLAHGILSDQRVFRSFLFDS